MKRQAISSAPQRSCRAMQDSARCLLRLLFGEVQADIATACTQDGIDPLVRPFSGHFTALPTCHKMALEFAQNGLSGNWFNLINKMNTNYLIVILSPFAHFEK